MLFSPDNTSCLSSSLSELRIFLPFEYVSVDTPAVLANLERTSTLSSWEIGVAEFFNSDFLSPPFNDLFKAACFSYIGLLNTIYMPSNSPKYSF